MERSHPNRHASLANVFQPIEYAVTVVVLKGCAGDRIVCSHLVEMALLSHTSVCAVSLSAVYQGWCLYV